jgi:Ser/Thr protein kinase RdoA (MazF antagonist)
MTDACTDFTSLTPDVLIDAVEEAIGKPLAGFSHPLNSYINRVYELQQMDGTRIIAKFYRPGRWTKEAIQDEHEFIAACAEEDIPVVPPQRLLNGTTLDEVGGIHFAVYEKRRGREFEACCEEDWRRLGRIVARMHVVGEQSQSKHRLVMHPEHSTRADLEQLLGGGFVTAKHRRAFEEVTSEIMEAICPPFENMDLIRIHGDCHCGNILERPPEGLMLIDFDDMVTGPPVQDLWMLLPGHARETRHEMNLILEGYEMFREFDDFSLKLIEPLRVMRLLYFQAWCSRQVGDPRFLHSFPDWGTDAFWGKEVADLRRQLAVIREYL